MSDAEKAFEAARRRIAKAKAEGAAELRFDELEFPGLSRLPEEISELTSLRLLSVNNPGVRELSPLSSLTGLEELWLDFVGAKDLSAIRRLIGLRSLSLRKTSIKDLSPLSGLSKLERLWLSESGLTDLLPLSGLSGLKDLRLNDTGVTDLSPLSGLSGLTWLWMENTGVTDLSPLSGLSGLATLGLNNTGVTDLSPLSGLSGLTMLWLNGTGVTDLSPLSGLSGLAELWLNNTGVTDLSPLSGLPGLTALYLDDTGVRDLSPLSGLSGLTAIGLNNTGVTDLSPLSGLPGPTMLWLNDTGVTDLSPLSGLSGLTALRLNNTDVTDLSPLAALTEVTTLSLDGASVVDLRPIRNMSSLVEGPPKSSFMRRGWQGLTFKNSAAARADPRIAKIAEIEDNAERARTLFDYLKDWEPPESEETDTQGERKSGSNGRDLAEAQLPSIQEIERLQAAFSNRAASLEIEIGTLSDKASSISKNIDELSAALLAARERLKANEEETEKKHGEFRESIQATSTEAKKSVEQAMEAAISAFREEQAFKEPVALWKMKQTEHESSAKTYFRLFCAGLVFIVAVTIGVVVGLALYPSVLDHVLSPVGCDTTKPETCQGFSIRGLIVTGGILTAFTVLLWFTRLQMKLYLAERHLALDARERQAFSQTYIGFLGEEGATEDAKDQRALVYAALFRPSSDGTVREDGGLDPSITAAFSKLLSK